LTFIYLLVVSFYNITPELTPLFPPTCQMSLCIADHFSVRCFPFVNFPLDYVCVFPDFPGLIRK